MQVLKTQFVSMKQWFFVLIELIHFDIEQRYHQLWRAILWFVIQPILLLGVYALILELMHGGVFVGDISTERWSLFIQKNLAQVMLGLLVLQFFLDSVQTIPQRFVSYSSLMLTKPIPRIQLHFSIMLSQGFSFCVAILLWIILSIWQGDNVVLHIERLIIVLLGTFFVVYCLALWMTAVTLYWRGVHHLIKAVILLCTVSAPIFYSFTTLHADWQVILIDFQPLTQLVLWWQWSFSLIKVEAAADWPIYQWCLTYILGCMGGYCFMKYSLKHQLEMWQT